MPLALLWHASPHAVATQALRHLNSVTSLVQVPAQLQSHQQKPLWLCLTQWQLPTEQACQAGQLDLKEVAQPDPASSPAVQDEQLTLARPASEEEEPLEVPTAAATAAADEAVEVEAVAVAVAVAAAAAVLALEQAQLHSTETAEHGCSRYEPCPHNLADPQPARRRWAQDLERERLASRH